MNLSEVRTIFGELSGRLDLITADSNNKYGADKYITEGSRMLDRLADIGNSEATIFLRARQGAFYLYVPNIRSLFEVYLYTSSQRYTLSLASKAQMRTWFNGTVDSDSQGIPAYYLPASFRIGDASSRNTPSDFVQKVDLTGQSPTGILFPPLSEACTFELNGHFYSAELENSNAENFWSREHPMLLAWAALYHLEVSYRNTEGAKDWMNSIQSSLLTIEFDHVAQVAAGVKQIGGREND